MVECCKQCKCPSHTKKTDRTLQQVSSVFPLMKQSITDYVKKQNLEREEEEVVLVMDRGRKGQQDTSQQQVKKN